MHHNHRNLPQGHTWKYKDTSSGRLPVTEAIITVNMGVDCKATTALPSEILLPEPVGHTSLRTHNEVGKQSHLELKEAVSLLLLL